MKYKQRGINDAYPEIIEIWEKGNPVPEWLSNNAKITFVDGDGNIQLGFVNYEDGSYEIINAAGTNTLVKLRSIEDLVCFGSNRIFGLTKEQFRLLYENA